ncbi:dual serine/threonine and tyrosine protein kinase-like [Octopus sinensis]|uniref:Dual serine/threonine and tyrosine protein kinase n=1 Tax=Octopus sinensis TaxID=2607531 RepID=A0A6P7T7N4_9MOLL|nr:dual serine/threonine and tyrosine protein kinase-like [Octopus sinensis]
MSDKVDNALPQTTMALVEEIQNFTENSQRLKQILEETKSLYEDIKIKTANIDQQDSPDTLLLNEENAEIMSVSCKPLTFVILGQSIYTKSCIVNEIIEEDILPTFDCNYDDELITRELLIKYGEVACATFILSYGYTVIEGLQGKKDSHHMQVHKDDIVINREEVTTDNDTFSTLEITLDDKILNSGAQIIVAPSNVPTEEMEEILKNYMENVLPVFIFTFKGKTLSEKEIEELTILQHLSCLEPILFARVSPTWQQTIDTDAPDGAPNEPICKEPNCVPERISETLMYQLDRLGFTDNLDGPKNITTNYFEVETCLVEDLKDFSQMLSRFVENMLKRYLINASTVLYNVHERCLGTFILSAFEMTRDLQMTPKKLEYAEKKEKELYQELIDISASKHKEITDIIQETISSLIENIEEKMVQHQFVGIEISEDGELKNSADIKQCTSEIQNFVLNELNIAIADKLINSVNVLKELYTGTLTRTLETLETDSEFADGARTTDALKQIMNAAYHVQITFESSSSFMRLFLEKMKQLILLVPWKTPPRIDLAWKNRAAVEILNNLCQSRLAKSISSQIKERLKKSHTTFLTALRQLEHKHVNRMDKIEVSRIRVRKIHAPKVAKLALESSSLKDNAFYGIPQMGREVGRGQYGVVYSCNSWGNYSPCAIKSVIPPDEKHWNDLAMELFYAKNIPEHDRIVSIRGSVIDYMYCGGLSPAVLLIMDRLQRDLHTAIKQHLDWLSRVQVAIDVVEGIRYLHSQGLVHRDIKMKNVLLDKQNRGKLTDLGFCKPEAMMSGSIVGTPIHMAPELFTGRYDNSVDIYAFGILFWYICSGKVQLPVAFDDCTSKDHLWHAVKRGLRPEKLKAFSPECWNIMQQCWHSEPSMRPLLGVVENRLRTIQQLAWNNFDKVNPTELPAKSQPITTKWFTRAKTPI